MMTGAFSPVHILVVLTVALIVLGPKELPRVARGLGRLLRELRALRERLDEELHVLVSEVEDGDEATPKPEIPEASEPAPGATKVAEPHE